MLTIISRYKEKLQNSSNPFVNSIRKHSPKYLGASAFSAVVSLFMTKYYTHVFDPAQFGVLALYTTMVQYLGNFIGFSVDASSQRVYFDYKGEERKEYFGTVLIFLTGSALIWLTILLLLKNVVVGYFGGSGIMYITTIILTILAMYVNFLSRICYNEHLSTLIFKQSIAQNASNHGGSFVFIAFLKMGILGRQTGQLFASSMNAIFYTRALRKEGILQVSFKFRYDILKRILHFAIPAFSTTVLASSLTYLDRIFLNYYHGAKDVGIFSLASSIAMLISFNVEAVSMALMPTIMKSLAEDYDLSIKKLKKFDKTFCFCLLLLGVIMIFSSDLLVRIFSNKNYQDAGRVIPLVAFGYVFGGFYKNVSSVLSFHSIVKFYPALTVFSFGITAVLNYLLIPRFQELGAGYSFAVGTLIYSMILHIIARKHYFSLKTTLIVYGSMFGFITALFVMYW